MDWYHNQASLARVRGDLCTLLPATELWVSTQSIVRNICASGSSSGLPKNSVSKNYQFIAMGADGIGCRGIGGITGCC